MRFLKLVSFPNEARGVNEGIRQTLVLGTCEGGKRGFDPYFNTPVLKKM